MKNVPDGDRTHARRVLSHRLVFGATLAVDTMGSLHLGILILIRCYYSLLNSNQFLQACLSYRVNFSSPRLRVVTEISIEEFKPTLIKLLSYRLTEMSMLPVTIIKYGTLNCI